MKKLTIILLILLVTGGATIVGAQANQTKGVHLEGMYSGHILATEFVDSTKTHTLKTVGDPTGEPQPVTEAYEDKVLMYKFLHREDDSTIIEATGDYSDAGMGKTAYILKPKPGEVIMVARMIISYRDNGTFDSGSYGNGITLTNGITSYFRRDGVDIYQGLDPNVPLLKNPGWAALCYDSRVDSYGSGEAQLSARFTFTTTGKYIRLDGNLGDEYVLYFHDNSTGLNSQSFLMQGYYETGPVE